MFDYKRTKEKAPKLDASSHKTYCIVRKYYMATSCRLAFSKSNSTILQLRISKISTIKS